MNLFEMDPKATCTERNLFRWTQQAIWLHIITHQKGLLSENLSDIIAAMTEKSQSIHGFPWVYTHRYLHI